MNKNLRVSAGGLFFLTLPYLVQGMFGNYNSLSISNSLKWVFLIKMPNVKKLQLAQQGYPNGIIRTGMHSFAWACEKSSD